MYIGKVRETCERLANRVEIPLGEKVVSFKFETCEIYIVVILIIFRDLRSLSVILKSIHNL